MKVMTACFSMVMSLNGKHTKLKVSSEMVLWMRPMQMFALTLPHMFMNITMIPYHDGHSLIN